VVSIAAVTDLISALLAQRVRRDGADPLITYYDLDSGERTELSAVSFANWVNKTSNLLVGELLVDPGDAVQLTLADTHPGHWVTLIWELACWQVGAVVNLDPAMTAKVMVFGPGTDWTTFSGTEAVFCSLHPLGLPSGPASPILDYNLEVRGQADQFPAVRQNASAAAWHSPGLDLDQSDLLAVDRSSSRRRLIVPADPWRTAQDALITPLVTGGSTVIVTGEASDAQLDRIRTSERAI
jgi:uncharacterized protein (TIGR03089 family)